jgi:hypothetical protein
MQKVGVSVEETSLLVQETNDTFSYLHYEKKSPLAVIFDESITTIIELVIDPSQADTAHMKATAETDYTNLLCTFFSAIPKFPGIEKLIKEEDGDLYFIDLPKAADHYLALQCRVFFDTLKQLNPKIGCSVYRQSAIQFTVIAQNRYDLPFLQRNTTLSELFEKQDEAVIFQQKGEELFFASQNTPGVFYLISFTNTAFLSQQQLHTLRLLATALLNIWRLR